MGGHDLGGAEEHFGSPGSRDEAPALERISRGLDGVGYVFGTGIREGADYLAGICWVFALELVIGRWLSPASVYVVLESLTHDRLYSHLS